jgi:hypothetical protein
MPNGVNTTDLASVLFAALVLAILLETALATLFTWPVFLAKINRRNARMPIALLVGIVIAWGMNFDLVSRVSATLSKDPMHLPSWLGILITGLILAGGSAGIRNVMASLGLVTPPQRLDPPPAPPENKAWISVSADRRNPETPLGVLFTVTDAAGATTGPEYAGIIAANARPPRGVFKLFVTNRARYPQVAGHAVDVGKKYKIQLRDENSLAILKTWPDCAFASGAIVDFEYSD